MTTAMKTVGQEGEDLTSSEPSGRPQPLDPEADAAEALKSLKESILSDVGPAAQQVAAWHGLDEYIEELCTYGVEKLSREPDDLQATAERLQNDLEEVSCGNYRALIESFECVGAVREGIADVRTRLDQLVEALPILAEATRQFSVEIAEKQKQREMHLRAMTEERAISDILDMPRLMSTLIGAELYDEALELREYTMKMTSMHSEEKIIVDMSKEIAILTQQMILRLLVTLKNPVQLPVCLRIVGFLRRLDVFSEFRLRMLFLQCRREWMRSGTDSTNATTQQAQLVALSDSTRAMMFEVITQYRAVFNDNLGEDEDNFEDSVRKKYSEGQIDSSTILFDWTSSCIANYLEKLEKGVKEITGCAALNTVLQQAMYCGQSLGRVGADFRSALPPMFEDAVLRIYNSHLNAALRQFEMMIDDNRWAPVGTSALRRERAQASMDVDKTDNKEGNSGEQNGEDTNEQYNPPLGILDSPPLAVFLNGILIALNDLRLCAPVTLGPKLGKILQTVLMSAAEYMSAVGGPGGAFLKRSDRPHFTAMSMSLRDLCVPHAARCLHHCMGRNGLVNVANLKKQLTDVFGDNLVPVALSKESEAKLNGTGGEIPLTTSEDYGVNANDSKKLDNHKHYSEGDEVEDINGKRVGSEYLVDERAEGYKGKVETREVNKGELVNGTNGVGVTDEENLIL